MERKKLIIILGAIGAAILLVFATIFPVVKNLLATSDDSEQVVTKVNLCDEDASGLCIVAFGAGTANDMIVVFQLPGTDYPSFYVKGINRGVENIYSCEAVSPTTILCTGARTPLGEPFDVEVYSTEGNLLIARGTVTVSSMAMSLPDNTGSGFGPMGKLSTPTPSSSPSPTPTSTPTAQITSTLPPITTPTMTATPDPAYPNP